MLMREEEEKMVAVVLFRHGDDDDVAVVAEVEPSFPLLHKIEQPTFQSVYQCRIFQRNTSYRELELRELREKKFEIFGDPT